MPIKQTTPQQQVDAYLDEQLRRIEKATLYNLAYVGERCINIARSTTKAGKNYLDQTGNLRSSVGYILVQDGRIIQTSTFNPIKTGSEGPKEGKSFAQELAGKYNQGIVLLLVAGMSYAAHVQDKGYDVLTSAELLAENLAPKLLKQLGIL